MRTLPDFFMEILIFKQAGAVLCIYLEDLKLQNQAIAKNDGNYAKLNQNCCKIFKMFVL